MKYHFDRHERHAPEFMRVIFMPAACNHGQAPQTQTAHARETAARSLAHAAHAVWHTRQKDHHDHTTNARFKTRRLQAGASLRTPGSARTLGAPASCGTRESLAPRHPRRPHQRSLPHRAADAHTRKKKAGGRSQLRLLTGHQRSTLRARWSPLLTSACPTTIYTCAHAQDRLSVEIGAQYGM